MIRVRKPAFWTPLILTVLLLGGAVRLQDELIYRRRFEPQRFRDSLYLPDSRYVKLVSLGYDDFAADFLWLRMIQSYAAGWSRPENRAQMKSYFDVITDLDPHYIEAYSFSVLALNEDNETTGHGDHLVFDTVDKAALHNPRDYQMPNEGAFHAFWKLKDAETAKYYVGVAMKDPDHPSFIERWPSYFDLKSGRFRAAYDKYVTDYANSLAGDPTVQSILRRALKRAINLWIIDAIKTRAVDWKKSHNGATPTIQQLQEAGAFKDVQLPDWPRIDAMFAQLQQSSDTGKVTVSSAQLQAIVNAGLHSWDGVPPSPYDDLTRDPSLKGYTIWQGLDENSEYFVLSRIQAIAQMKKNLPALEGYAEDYRQKHKGQYPEKIEEFGREFLAIGDAFGGKWTWDPKTHKVGCTSVPNLESYSFPDVE